MPAQMPLLPHKVLREDTEDGAILLRSGYPRSEVAPNIGWWLDRAVEIAPDRVFLAERAGAGWREITYRQTKPEVMRLAAGLLEMGLGPKAPLLILSGNSVNHGLLALAAHYVGIPFCPVAEQYSLIPSALSRLQYVLNLIDPVAVYAEDGAQFAGALSLPEMAGRQVICAANLSDGATALSDLSGHADVASARDAVTHSTVAKYLLTSGSTSDPKAVVTTHGMLCANQAMWYDGMPSAFARPPVLVDWLPWNHTFGGSANFNIVLSHAGSLYIDDGKPLPALFPRTLENLGMISGTIGMNVPVGFAQLVTAMRADPALARTYFADMDLLLYAGASLPQDTWDALEDIAMQAVGRVPFITTCWGLTETSPAAIFQHEPTQGAGQVGVPMTGLTVKLIPDETGRLDVRVKGDSIFSDYLRNPDKTDASFDADGFFITGDAMRFVDPEDMTKGLRFDGRLSEDFKLQTGTWVQAANLRLDLLTALAPFAQDVVMTGEGRTEIGALIIPNRAAIEAAGFTMSPRAGAEHAPDLQAELAQRLARLAQEATGASKRVTRALILSDPPSMGEGEITAKGNLNFARLLQLRAGLVDRLYEGTDPEVIHV